MIRDRRIERTPGIPNENHRETIFVAGDRDEVDANHDDDSFEILSQDFDAYIERVRREVISPVPSNRKTRDGRINTNPFVPTRRARSRDETRVEKNNPLYENWPRDPARPDADTRHDSPRPPPIFKPTLPRRDETSQFPSSLSRAHDDENDEYECEYDDAAEVATVEDEPIYTEIPDRRQNPFAIGTSRSSISPEETTDDRWPAARPPSLPPRQSPAFIYDVPRKTRDDDLTRDRQPTKPNPSLRFSKNLLSDNDASFLRSCIRKTHHGDVAAIVDCRPVNVYALDAMIDPVISDKATKIAELAKPTIKLIVMINYYYVGMSKLAEMKVLSGRLLTPACLRELKHRLEPLVRTYGEHLALPLRLMGRTNISDEQHACCLNGIAAISPAGANLPTGSRNLKSRNGLFKTTRFATAEGQALYARNLDVLNSGSGHGDELRLQMSENAETLTETQLLDDVLFIISMGNMLATFDKNLRTLFAFIQHRLEELTELLYFAYLQLPHTEDTYRRLSDDVAAQRRSTDHRNFALRSVVCRLVEFLRQALASGLFILPTYMRFVVRSALVPDATIDRDLQLRRAAALLDDEHIFKATVSENAARRLIARDVSFSEIRGATTCEGRVPLTTTTVHSASELIAAAIDIVSIPPVPLRPRHLSRARPTPQ